MSDIKARNLIGVFDSGLGGLTVFKNLLQELPDYNYVYLGDNAHLPYGNKSPETIYRYSREAVKFLFAEGCNLILIACNTASAQALRRLQQEYLPAHYPQRRILGVIRPLAEAAGKNQTHRVGVIGTKATINSGAYVSEIKKLWPKLEVFQQSAPLLVPLIEEGWLKKPESKMILKKYLRPLKNKNLDLLILGCTHYPLLYKDIKRLMGRRCFVPDPGQIVAESLKDYLKRHPELELETVAEPKRRYYTTDNPEFFSAWAKKLLGREMRAAEKAQIASR